MKEKPVIRIKTDEQTYERYKFLPYNSKIVSVFINLFFEKISQGNAIELLWQATLPNGPSLKDAIVMILTEQAPEKSLVEQIQESISKKEDKEISKEPEKENKEQTKSQRALFSSWWQAE